MALRMNLWSLTLLPGEKFPMYVRRDFQITNAALGEELRSESGRSVVKVTHNPINPAVFDSDSDSEDEELDSELEDELMDEFELDEEDDEEEDDEEEEVEAKVGKKVNGKKADVDGEDEEDEDEDDEDEDDEDFSDDEDVLETSVLCSLTAGKIEQAQLNLVFTEGEVVMFEVTGENAVHLLGNYIYQGQEEEDSEFDSDSEYDDYDDLSFDEDEEMSEGGEATLEELDEEDVPAKALPTKATKAKAEATKLAAAPVADKKRKADEIESPAAKASAAADTSIDGLSKNQRKKLAKKAKVEGEAAAPAAPAKAEGKPAQQSSKQGQKKTLPSGLIIEDIKVGGGPVARTGKRLGMRYIGKLESGKQFDANTSGKPFSFVLGKGEVIRGWDEGLAGMSVGGERRLTIPAGLAYGNQKLPGIPKNSTLKFDVKLVSVA